MSEAIYNLADPAVKRDLMARIGTLKPAMYRVEFTKVRKGLTDPQRAFYFAAIVPAFAQVMREHDAELNDAQSRESAHETLKGRFFRRDIVKKDTGEVIGSRVPSLRELNVAQMSEYIDQCISWLAKDWDVIVPDPAAYMAA